MDCLPIASSRIYPWLFWWVRVDHPFSFLRCVFFYSFVCLCSVLCLMLSVSQDCQYLIVYLFLFWHLLCAEIINVVYYFRNRLNIAMTFNVMDENFYNSYTSAMESWGMQIRPCFPMNRVPEFTPSFLVGSMLLIKRLCCPIMCFYILSSVLWCPLQFPNKNDVRFVSTSGCL